MTVNTLGADMAGGKARSAEWLQPLVPIAIATFALSALVSYHLRADGGTESRSLLQQVIIGIYQFVGFVPSFLFFLLVLSWSTIWFVTGKLERPGARLLRLLGLTLSLAICANLWTRPGEVLPHSGALGAWLAGRMVSVLGAVLSTLLLVPLTFVSLLLATDTFFVSYFEGIGTARKPEPEDEEAGTDVGVEAEVAEHLKSLSTVFSGPRGAAVLSRRSPTAIAPTLGDLVAIDDLEAAVQSMEDAAEGRAAAPTANADDAEPPRRLSYFERRQLAEARAAAAAAAAGLADAGQDDGVTEEEEGDDEGIVVADAEGLADSPAVAAADEATASAESDPDASFASATAELARRAAAAAIEDLDVAAAPSDRGRLAPVVADDASVDPASSAAEPVAVAAPSVDGAAAVLADEGADDLAQDVVEDADELEGRDGDDDATASASDDEHEDADEDERAEAGERAERNRVDGDDLAVTDDDADDDADLDALLAAGADVQLDQVTIPAAAPAATPLPARSEPVAEPVVAIPRPPEGVRQQRLFLNGLDEALVREATDLVQASRRASAAMLQRKLRIEFDQAVEVLALLAHRGVIDLADDGTQGRVRS